MLITLTQHINNTTLVAPLLPITMTAYHIVLITLTQHIYNTTLVAPPLSITIIAYGAFAEKIGMPQFEAYEYIQDGDEGHGCQEEYARVDFECVLP